MRIQGIHLQGLAPPRGEHQIACEPGYNAILVSDPATGRRLVELVSQLLYPPAEMSAQLDWVAPAETSPARADLALKFGADALRVPVRVARDTRARAAHPADRGSGQLLRIRRRCGWSRARIATARRRDPDSAHRCESRRLDPARGSRSLALAARPIGCKRAANQSHARWIGPGIDCDHVEAHRVVARGSRPCEELPGCAHDATLLAERYRLLCGPEGAAAAQPHLDEAQRLAVEPEQIEFRVTEVQVPG